MPHKVETTSSDKTLLAGQTSQSGHASSTDARRVLRSAALILAQHEIRSVRRWFDEFERDILLPILLGEIALHNVGALQHGLARRAHNGHAHKKHVKPGELPDELMHKMNPCNAYSIAAATGLPRETVRRKIVRLVDMGWIVRNDSGHLYITEGALEQFGALLSSRALGELLETADRLRTLLEEQPG
ncbi:MAG: hypothetical protein AB7S63_02960 [Thauera sp.]|jgi:hypothetical protein